MKSKRFTLNIEEIKKVAKNALIFLTPAIILFLTELGKGNGFSEALPVVYLWLINVAIDLLRKFSQGTK